MKLNQLMKRLLALMAAAALTLSAAIPQAGATGITFHNYKPDQPDLYVRKTVTSAATGIEAPKDDVFTFTLLLDGTPAKDMEYTVINIDGSEDKLPNSAIRKTDREGTFQLKADQTARFLFVGSGKSYTVIESTKANYQQISPAGGPAVGTVEPDGTQVDFVNKYIPPELPPNETPVPAELTVTKSIRYPEGYQMPAAAAEQQFAFELRIDGEPYALEYYDILNSAGTAVGRGLTDSDGALTLRGGETARFTNVPANVDYEVKELVNEDGLVLDGEGNPTGWYQTDSDGTEGATGSVTTSALFTNTNAAFLVSKKVSGVNINPDDSFTFRLVKGVNREEWSETASYYLYDTMGGLIDEELHSAPNGRFTLKGGQAALFVGIPVGTIYGVQEERSGEYTQIFPEDPQGYTDKVVSSSVEVLPFENQKEDWEGTLVVQKTLRVEGDKAPGISHSFRFRLEEKDPDDAEWTASAQRYYQIYDDIFQTAEDGTFELKAGETAQFDKLPPNKLYRASELWKEMEFGKDGSVYQSYYIDPAEAVQETGMTMDRPARLEFVNVYDTDTYKLRLTKTDEKGHPLQGAVFRLYQDEACTIPLRDGAEFVSAYDGVLLIEGLKRGTYYLLETAAPAGYRPLGKPLKIVVESPDTSCDGQTITPVDRIIDLQVANWKEFGLPGTGADYPPFIIVGLLSIVVIAILVYNFKFFGRKKSDKQKERGKQK